MHKTMWLRFDKPAADTDYDWERRSFPMGNGYMGVNLFGGVSTERLQITENSLVTCPSEYIKCHWCCGLENFAELYIDFPHAIEQVSGYERALCLNTGIATVTYQQDGVTYTRETFGSYPDRVWALRLTASRPGALQVRLRPYSPHNRETGGASTANASPPATRWCRPANRSITVCSLKDSIRLFWSRAAPAPPKTTPTGKTAP